MVEWYCIKQAEPTNFSDLGNVAHESERKYYPPDQSNEQKQKKKREKN